MRTNTTTRVITPTSPWLGPAFSTNTTAAAFATIEPTLTLPATSSANGAAILPASNARLRLCFFGEGADNTTFDIKVVGWSRVSVEGASVDPPANPDKTIEWIPSALAVFTVTLGALTGAAGGVLGGATHRISDLITPGSYTTDSVKITSPGDGLAATVEMENLGFQKFGVYFDMTGATNGNVLYANI